MTGRNFFTCRHSRLRVGNAKQHRMTSVTSQRSELKVMGGISPMMIRPTT